MKSGITVIFLVLLCCIGLAALSGCEESAPAPPVVEPVGNVDYAAMEEMGHPRLLMTSDDFVDLKNKVTNERDGNKALYEMHKVVLHHADVCLKSNDVIQYKLDASNKRLLSQCSKALKRLFCCSYAYRLTGSKQYFNKVVADLNTVCSFKDWNAQKHFLDVGEMALGVAIAYDWLYSVLPEETKTMVRTALKTFALAPSVGHNFHKRLNNWNQVCNCGVVAAAIAMYESERLLCANVINSALEDNGVAIEAMYAPDGNYPEGYNYWGYGTGFQVLMLQALQTVFGFTAGLAEVEGFQETAEYMLFMAGPVGKDFPYADGGGTRESSKAAMWWFAAQKKDPSMLINEWRMLEQGRYKSGDDARILPMVPCMIKDAGFNDISAAKPSKEIWYGNGEVPVAMIHTGWDFDENDFYVGIKGGAAKHSHGHMDAGSFVFDSQGVRWSDDLYRPAYATVENALSGVGGNFWSMTQESLRWDIFRMNNLSHSTVSFENSDGSVGKKVHSTDHNVAGTAYIEKVYEDRNEYGATLNMTAPLQDQVAEAKRTIRLVDRKDLVITDEITAKSSMDAKMQWRMTTPASVTVKDDVEILAQNDKTLYLKASNDASLQIKYEVWEPVRPSTWTPRTWDDPNDGYMIAGYTATIPAGTKAVFTTVLSAAE